MNTVVASPVRRLSHTEYARTVAELFPGVTMPELNFADDLRVHGFENNAQSLNPAAVLIEEYADTAELIAERVGATPSSVLPCTPSGDDMDCASEFIASFGERAFRRPLSAEEQARFETFFGQQMDAISFRGALELTVQAFLQAPEFLYRLEYGGDEDGAAVLLDDYELASRLSYFLWQSMPDDELLEAAAKGALHTAEQLETQARRMLDDPRATDAVVDFHRQWLDLDRLLAENKDPQLFPEWSDDLRADMREESNRFVSWAWSSGGATFSKLLTSRTSFVNGKLAELYGVAGSGDDWRQVELPAERAGFLTRANFLASRAHSTNGSPPLRGVAILDQLLCNRPPPPPPSADTSTPTNSGGAPKTNRELFETRTSSALCQSCHQQINGIGYGLEAFDAVGRFRTLDNGLPVDTSGELRGTDVDGSFANPAELSAKLAESEQVQYCGIRNWYRYALGRDDDEQGGDSCKLDALYDRLQQHDGDVRELLLGIATSYEFMHRPKLD